MHMRDVLMPAALGIWLIFGAASATAAEAQLPKNITLTELLDVVKLHKGKVVAINFFATWCPACREEIPGLTALVDEFPANKLAVIGVSVDENPEAVMPFVERFKINYPVFRAGLDVVEGYAVRTIPHNVFYDVEGKPAAGLPGLTTREELKEFVDKLLKEGK